MQTAVKARLWQIDALRGTALISMLFYHGMYDWVYLFGHTGGWYDIFAPGVHLWQQSICWSFILIAGFSFGLCRRPWRHGLQLALGAAALTAVTLAVMPSQRILFGIFHFMACAVLLTAALRPVLRRLPAPAGLALFAALFALTDQLPFGRLGFEGLTMAALPAAWYKTNLFWLGFQDPQRFFSADYFPLLPWWFLFLCGWYLYRLLAPRLDALRAPAPRTLRPLCAVGGNTFWIYLLHQPVLFALTWALDKIL